VSTDRYHGILQEHREVSHEEMLQAHYDNQKQINPTNSPLIFFEIMTTRLEILRSYLLQRIEGNAMHDQMFYRVIISPSSAFDQLKRQSVTMP